MGKKITYAFVGVIVGFVFGAVINQFILLFPGLLTLLFVPGLILGIWGVVLAERVIVKQSGGGEKNILIAPLVITFVIVILYGFYWSLIILPAQKESAERLQNLLEKVESFRELN